MLTGTFSGLTTVGSFGQAQVSLSYDSHDVFLTIVAPPVTVIESYGSTSLVQVGNNYFLYPVGGSSGPELSVWGAPVVAGQFGSWSPVGAEITASGYDVAWTNGTGQFSIWGTDSKGNYVFSGLAAGTYIIREVRLTNWVRTQPAGAYPLGYYKITLTSSQSAINDNFGNYLG